jgi:hypothetical protein
MCLILILTKIKKCNEIKYSSYIFIRIIKNGNEVIRIVGLSLKEKYETFVNNALTV